MVYITVLHAALLSVDTVITCAFREKKKKGGKVEPKKKSVGEKEKRRKVETRALRVKSSSPARRARLNLITTEAANARCVTDASPLGFTGVM